MRLNNNASIFIPDRSEADIAFQSAHQGSIGIGAHQDDLEIFAIHGIGRAYTGDTPKFVGVTVTSGDGSPRKGPFADYTNEEMMETRKAEQDEAATIGKYAAQIQLGYKSNEIKGKEPQKGAQLAYDIREILLKIHPSIVYVHNPFDKHETHLAITRATLQALRQLPKDKQPDKVYGCEVWRGLDWLMNDNKTALDISGYLDLQRQLINCHRSQIAGSKNYTDATIGRELANATFLGSHELEEAIAMTYAVDLTPFLSDQSLTMENFLDMHLKPFVDELASKAKEYELPEE